MVLCFLVAGDVVQCNVSPKLQDGFNVLHVSWGPKKDPAGVPPPPVQIPRGPRTYLEARDRWLVKPIRTTRKNWTEPVRL